MPVRERGSGPEYAGAVRQAGLFLDAVEGGPPPPCSIDEGLQTLRVNLAALKSIEARAWQDTS